MRIKIWTTIVAVAITALVVDFGSANQPTIGGPETLGTPNQAQLCLAKPAVQPYLVARVAQPPSTSLTRATIVTTQAPTKSTVKASISDLSNSRGRPMQTCHQDTFRARRSRSRNQMTDRSSMLATTCQMLVDLMSTPSPSSIGWRKSITMGWLIIRMHRPSASLSIIALQAATMSLPGARSLDAV